MKKILFSVLIAAIVLAGVGLILNNSVLKSSPAASPMQASTSYDMNGTWNQTSGMDGVDMTADIEDGTITVTMHLKDESGVYWIGSFEGGSIDNTPNTGVLVSQGDVHAMANLLLASQASTKEFTFNSKTHDLSFQFSMLGATSTVHMSRSSE